MAVDAIFDIDYIGSMDNTTKKPILNFVIDPRLLKRIDDFRFRHRFPTRAAAVKWLLEWALKQKPDPAKEA